MFWRQNNATRHTIDESTWLVGGVAAACTSFSIGRHKRCIATPELKTFPLQKLKHKHESQELCGIVSLPAPRKWQQSSSRGLLNNTNTIFEQINNNSILKRLAANCIHILHSQLNQSFLLAFAVRINK